MKKLILIAAAAAMVLAYACDKKDADGGDKKGDDKAAAAGAAVDSDFAKSDAGKAWTSWKDEACKCKDMACASKAASSRTKVEEKHNPGAGPPAGAAGIIKEATACLQTAMKPPAPK